MRADQMPPEKIFGWLNGPLSIARHYGGCKFNGHEYRIATGEDGQPLVRIDVLAKEKRKTRRQQGGEG